MKDTQPIRVLLADDEPSIRRGLRMRLELEPDIQVVAEAEDGRAAVQLAKLLAPDVIVMDLHMPHLDGITATEAIAQTLPRAAVVLHSLQDDDATRARACIAGASAFVSKHERGDALLDAIRGST